MQKYDRINNNKTVSKPKIKPKKSLERSKTQRSAEKVSMINKKTKDQLVYDLLKVYI